MLARSAVLDNTLLNLHGYLQRYENKANKIMGKQNQILEKFNGN